MREKPGKRTTDDAEARYAGQIYVPEKRVLPSSNRVHRPY